MSLSHPSVGGLRLVFGGNVFGWTLDRDGSFAVLDAFYEAGGRMVDSADGYSSWVPGNKGGESEALLGEWMEARGVRKDMLVATKTGMGGVPGSLRPEAIAAALEASLDRLRTNYVDLYYAHRDDPQTPIDEVIGAYDAALKAGKARELGASNHTVARLREIFAVAERMDAASYTVIQPQHNLVYRSEYDGPMRQLARERSLAVVPYYGLASGFLTGKFRTAADWRGSSRAVALEHFAANGGWAMLESMDRVAAATGGTHAQIALAWLNAQVGITAPVASATSAAQLQDLVAGAALVLNSQQLALLDAASR